ncbi:MAG TPA: mycofactocin biosynthesis glycosyltransferase MftF, partial [Dermatophilaceae bacterium]|nr:mycofactocin biosynthesis glycosyltransferase MftF [Dermatophilaceae bacterium]
VGAAPASDAALPDGFAVAVNPRTVVGPGRAWLAGGFPGRVVLLSEQARQAWPAPVLTVTDGVSGRLARRLLDAGLVDPVVDPPARDDAVELPLTVVVPVHGRSGGVDRLLTGLAGAFPVVVVDDASPRPDEIARVVQGHHASLIRTGDPARRGAPSGPAAARNAGLARVATPAVAFVDSDVVCDPGTLRRLARHLADPRTAAAAPRVAALIGTGRWILRYEAIASSLDLGPIPGQVRPGGPVGHLPSACLVARVPALGDGFDEGMVVGEDVDLIWRLVEAGWVVRYDPTTQVQHDHRSGPYRFAVRRARYGTSAAPLATRHRGAAVPAVLNPTGLAVAVAVLSARAWSLPVAGAVVVAAAARVRRRLPSQLGSKRTGLAARLSVLGAFSQLRQAAGLLLRPWWPLTAVGVLTSHTARRVALAALVVDTVLDERARSASTSARTRALAGAYALGYLAARRLDDLAYGAGVWRGAAISRSWAPLRPVWQGRPGWPARPPRG